MQGFAEDAILVPETAKDEAFLQRLRELQPDLCITAAYGNFLPQVGPSCACLFICFRF